MDLTRLNLRLKEDLTGVKLRLTDKIKIAINQDSTRTKTKPG